MFSIVSFNQEKAIVGAFSVITNLRMDLFEALVLTLTCSNTASLVGIALVLNICCISLTREKRSVHPGHACAVMSMSGTPPRPSG